MDYSDAVLKEAFDAADVDRDGYIVFQELLKMLRSLDGEQLTISQMKAAFKMFDENGDQKISFHEFKNGFKSLTTMFF